jgi:hypothetical protein
VSRQEVSKKKCRVASLVETRNFDAVARVGSVCADVQEQFYKVAYTSLQKRQFENEKRNRPLKKNLIAATHGGVLWSGV